MASKKCWISGILATILSMAFIACSNPVDTTPELPVTSNTGSIAGWAVFADGASHSGITITLEQTDGLRSLSATNASRSIAAGAQSIGTRSVAATTQTAADGSFSLNNIPAGTYTLYASSRDSLEQAVAIGVTVRAGEVFDAGTLRLTPVGNISGRITMDGSGGMGFLVSVAGTSFMAVTNTDGDFLISGVPVGNHHVIVVRGNFTRLLTTTPLSVSGGQTTPLGTWDFTGDELIGSIVSICPDTGNWLIDGEDTGIPSQGPQGPAVTIAGIPVIGQTLTAITTLTGVSFQWERGTTPIWGATGSTYIVCCCDAGYAIRVVVSRSGHADVVGGPTEPVIVQTVTNVTVSPATAFVERGGMLDFTATVDGTNDPPQGVTWEIGWENWQGVTVWDTNTGDGTTINSSGGLTVSATETLTTLSVRATETFSPAWDRLSGEATVSIPVPPVPPTPTVTNVTVSPATAFVERGGTLDFTATVDGTNDPPQGVTWQILDNLGRWSTTTSAGTTINSSGGLTVSSTETLTTLTVRATSMADTSISGTATVTVLIPAVTSVTVSPATAFVERGGTLDFTAIVDGTNDPPQGVTWQIWYVGWSTTTSAGTTINSSGGLTVSSTETLTTLTVGAVSMVDTSIMGQATVTVLIPTVTSVTVSPAAISVARGGTHNFTATVAGTNNPPQGVIWEIWCDWRGWRDTTGEGTTINSSGGLTVSSTETQTTLRVRATSMFDTWPQISGEATVSVPQP